MTLQTLSTFLGPFLFAGYTFAQSPSMTPSTFPPQSDTASPGIRSVRGAYMGHLGDADLGEWMGKLEDRDPNAPPAEIFGYAPLQMVDEFPGDRANVILIGQITRIQAFLSNNHASIYTENTIRVEQVIDQTPQAGQPGHNSWRLFLRLQSGRLGSVES